MISVSRGTFFGNLTRLLINRRHKVKMIAAYWVDHDPSDDEKSLLDSQQLRFEE